MQAEAVAIASCDASQLLTRSLGKAIAIGASDRNCILVAENVESTDPAASGRGMEADLLPNSKSGLQASCFRRRATGNLPALD